MLLRKNFLAWKNMHDIPHRGRCLRYSCQKAHRSPLTPGFVRWLPLKILRALPAIKGRPSNETNEVRPWSRADCPNTSRRTPMCAYAHTRYLKIKITNNEHNHNQFLPLGRSTVCHKTTCIVFHKTMCETRQGFQADSEFRPNHHRSQRNTRGPVS